MPESAIGSDNDLGFVQYEQTSDNGVDNFLSLVITPYNVTQGYVDIIYRGRRIRISPFTIEHFYSEKPQFRIKDLGNTADGYLYVELDLRRINPSTTVSIGTQQNSSTADELGTSRWTTPDELRQRFSFDDSQFAPTPDYLWNGRSNGQLWLGGTADQLSSPLGYQDDRHVCLVSGNRGGKGTTSIIPNLCFWPGSCVIIDPKGENANVTARRRGAGSEYCYGLGQNVHILDPFNEIQLDASLKSRFNPLDAIDPDSDFAVDDAGRVASAMVVNEGDGKGDRFFEEAAHNLLKGLILHVLTDASFEGIRSLISVWRLVNQGDWISVAALREAGRENIASAFDLLWEGMRENPRYNGLISGLGEEMLTMPSKTRDGIRKTAASHLDFISGGPMQRLLEASDFDLADIKSNPKGTTLYLTLPQRYMKTHFRWLRLMTDLAVGEMERIKGKPATGYPTLFLLDEFAGLKRMEVIEHAAAQAAGFGVKFFFIVQSLVQLKDVYKESWEVFFGNSGVKMFFNIEDDFTRQYLSRQLGEREVQRHSESGSQSRSAGVSQTEGQSFTSTAGTGTSRQEGSSVGTSDTRTSGGNRGWSTGRSSGGSESGGAILFGLLRGITNSFGTMWNRNSNVSGGSNWSSAKGRNSSYSESSTLSENRSEARGSSTSFGTSATTGETQGWSTSVHKRLLLNPDEIGRLLAPTTRRDDPSYPGLAAVLIVGAHPILLRRVNYYHSSWFAGLFDPHPDHPIPPTLLERRSAAEKDAKARATEAAAKQAAASATPQKSKLGEEKWWYSAAAYGAIGILGITFIVLRHPSKLTPINDSPLVDPARLAQILPTLRTENSSARTPDCPIPLSLSTANCRFAFDGLKSVNFYPPNSDTPTVVQVREVIIEAVAPDSAGRPDPATVWFRVNFDSGPAGDPMRGHMSMMALRRAQQVPATPPGNSASAGTQGGQFAVVSTTRLNLRRGPGPNFDVVAEMPQGLRVRVLMDAANGWKMVEASGQGTEVFRGFANGQYLTPAQ